MSLTTTAYFRSEITLVGDDADELVDGGVVIFFGEPCPKELAAVSVVHRPQFSDPQRPPRVGDVLRIGDTEVVFTAVGELAADNLLTLGHIVVYCDPEDGQKMLPGAIHARGRLTLPTAGQTIELIGA